MQALIEPALLDTVGTGLVVGPHGKMTAKATGAEVAGTGLVVGPRSRHRSGFYCPGGWWTSEQPDVLAGVHLGGLGCGPLAAAYALLPTVVSASRPAMTSDNSFFFTILPFPYRSGTKPESSSRGAAILLHSSPSI